LRRYELTCPHCREKGNISAKLNEPSELFCNDCDEDIDLDVLRAFVDAWRKFIVDYDEMIKREENEEKMMIEERENHEDN